MNSLEKYQFFMKCLATFACLVQAYVYGPSVGLGACHGIFLYCTWMNRDKIK